MADTLINDEKLRTYYDISTDIKPSRLTPHIGAASRRLKSWVGADAYADALADAPEDALRKVDLENAEAALAMHYALPGLHTKLGPNGVVKSKKESGSVGAPVTVTFFTPREVGELAQMYLDQAEEIARPYMLSDGTPDAGIGVVEDE